MTQQNPIAHSIWSRLSVSQFSSSTTLTIPYSPLPNQYPIYSQEDLVSFATTKIEAIDGNPLNSLDPAYKCICSRPTLAALLYATGEEVLLPLWGEPYSCALNPSTPSSSDPLSLCQSQD